MRKTNLSSALVAMLLVMGSGTVNSADYPYYIGDGSIRVINDNSGTVTIDTNNPLYIYTEMLLFGIQRGLKLYLGKMLLHRQACMRRMKFSM